MSDMSSNPSFPGSPKLTIAAFASIGWSEARFKRGAITKNHNRK